MRTSTCIIVTFSSFIFLLGCATKDPAQNLRTKAIEEIQQAEKDFEQMAADKGITEAFWFYADSNAVIKRQNDTLVIGKERVHQYYMDPSYARASATWSPDFTDASANGDMGYTYGKYKWEVKDSTGKVTAFHGIFHTVWKRQTDGSWKFVWD